MALVTRDLENDTYIRENYLGKGAFSKSYILRKDGVVFCGKFIPKSKTQLEKNLDSIREFSILSKLEHKNIVNFVDYIETQSNFCLITEYYPHKSMFELIQRRSKLTIYEVRYFSRQLLSALKYIHDINIVHRDIKPQNMLLDESMNLKLADFGMAVICQENSSIYKCHIYGTPNYISPEMITKTIIRYNYKVDIWAVGCFLYHMFTGKTPFRGKEEKILYNNIQLCTYTIPSEMPQCLAYLITKILQKDPESRPTSRQIINDDFYKNGFTPNTLPITALVDKPKFIVPPKEIKSLNHKINQASNEYCENKCLRKYLTHFKNYIDRLLNRSPTKAQSGETMYHEIEYPTLDPVVWINQIVKENNNIGYMLNDGTSGVLFEDKTVLVLLTNRINLYYVTNDKQIKFYTLSKPSSSLTSKLKTLRTLLDVRVSVAKSTSSNLSENSDWLPMLPYLQSFYETTKYYIALMSNGLYQVISKGGEITLLLCMKSSGFSILTKGSQLKTYDLHSLSEFQFPHGLYRHLEITCSSLHRVLAKSVCFACKKNIEIKLNDNAITKTKENLT